MFFELSVEDQMSQLTQVYLQIYKTLQHYNFLTCKYKLFNKVI